MISVSNLEKTFGDRTLFADVSFQLNPGQRYGLVGANGSGKTTLLNILTGDEGASGGDIAIPRRLKIGVLRQDQFLFEEHSILTVALMGNQALWKVMEEKEKLLANAEHDFDADRFSELEEQIMRLDGYTAEAKAAMILEGLGLPAEIHHDPLSTLSGGFKLRVLLAQVLAGEPDALLLDEPTNHLDILSIRWLETFLRDFAGPVLVISHDHRFLDNVCSNILDVDYQTVTLYRGNYTAFVEAKAGERERREREAANAERQIAHHQQFVDRFRAKATKARQAGSKLRLIERMAQDIPDLPPTSRRYPTFRFVPKRDSGRDVLKVKGIRKAYEDNEVLHGVDLEVQRGDRIAIMGPNGIGKSTLLKIVMGDTDADAGTVEWGYETHPGYFAQDHGEQFSNPRHTAEAWAWEVVPDQTISFVRGNLGLVLFSGDDVEKRLGDLSGGEAARLVFCRLAMLKPNVLVLDEPTNHLDLESIEALVEGLRTFPGTLIFVSHDRWFVSQLASRIIEIRPDGIRDYHGTYDEYVHFCGDDHLDVDRVVLKARSEKKKRREEADDDDGAPKGNGRDDGGSAPQGSKPDAQRGGRRRGKGRGARDAGDGTAAAPRSGGGGNGSTKTKGDGGGLSKARRRQLRAHQDELLKRIDTAETRMREIDDMFCAAGFYDQNDADRVKDLQMERAELERDVEQLTGEWERGEETLAG